MLNSMHASAPVKTPVRGTPELTPTELDKAYAAGWFDSRGYVRMSVSKGRTPRLTLHIQSGRLLPLFLFDRWGGVVGVNKAAPGSIKLNGYIGGVRSWQINRLPAKKFLVDIQPFAQARSEVIKLAISFIEHAVEKDPKENRQYLATLADDIKEESVKAMTWSD